MENVWPAQSSSGFKPQTGKYSQSSMGCQRHLPPIPRGQGPPDPAEGLQRTFGCSWDKGRSTRAHQGMVLVVFARLYLKLYHSKSAPKPPHPGSAPSLLLLPLPWAASCLGNSLGRGQAPPSTAANAPSCGYLSEMGSVLTQPQSPAVQRGKGPFIPRNLGPHLQSPHPGLTFAAAGTS